MLFDAVSTTLQVHFGDTLEGVRLQESECA